MRVWLTVLAASLAIVGGIRTIKKDSEPVGYVIRVSKGGTVFLTHNKQRTTVDSAALKKTVYVYGGDTFDGRGAWSVYFFENSKVCRRPMRSNPPVGQARSAQDAAKGILGGRRQGQIPEPRSQMIAAVNPNPIVAIEGLPLKLAFAAAPGDKINTIDIVFNEKTISFEGNSKAIRQLGPLSVLTIEKVPSELDGIAQFEVKVTFSSGKVQIALFKGFEGAQAPIRERLRQLQTTDFDSADWFESFNQALLYLEQAGCKSQAAAMVLDWYIREPENIAAREAARGVAIDMDAPSLERFLKDGGE